MGAALGHDLVEQTSQIDAVPESAVFELPSRNALGDIESAAEADDESVQVGARARTASGDPQIAGYSTGEQ